MLTAVVIGAGCLSLPSACAQDGEKSLAVQALSASIQDQAARLHIKVNHPGHIYEIGEVFEVAVTSRISGFLYLLYVHSDDSVNVLFPNAFQEDNHILSGKTYLIPGADTFRIAAVLPMGNGTFKAIVTNHPLESLSVSLIAPAGAMLELDLKDIDILKEELAKGVGVRLVPQNAQSTRILADHSAKITTVKAGRFGPGKRVLREKRRFVLAIGVGEQLADGPRDYPACAKEAKEFAALMTDAYDASEVVVLINDQATRSNVEKMFRQLAEKTRPGDEFILFWSGHGDQLKDDAREERDGVDEILVLYDTRLDNDELKRSTSVTDDQLGRWLQDFSHCEVLVLFDTCFSGGQADNEKSISTARRKKASDYAKRVPQSRTPDSRGMPDTWEGDFNTFTKDITPRQAMVISSSRAGQVSYVREELDNSVMSFYLLEYLKTHRGRRFTPQDLFEDIAAKATSYVEETFGVDQTPVIIGKDRSAIEF